MASFTIIEKKSFVASEEVFISTTAAGGRASFTSTGSVSKTRRRFSFTKTKDDEREQLAKA